MGLAKRMPLRSADFHQILQPNTFKNGKLALRSGILRGIACPEVMHRPTYDSPVHFDKGKKKKIRKYNASARRLPPAAMPERWLQVCDKIMFQLNSKKARTQTYMDLILRLNAEVLYYCFK